MLCPRPIPFQAQLMGSSSGEDCQPGRSYRCLGGVGRLLAYPAATAAAARANDHSCAAARRAVRGAERAATAAGACGSPLPAPALRAPQGRASSCRAPRRASPRRASRAPRGPGCRYRAAAGLFGRTVDAGSDAAAGQPAAARPAAELDALAAHGNKGASAPLLVSGIWTAGVPRALLSKMRTVRPRPCDQPRCFRYWATKSQPTLLA